MKGERRWLGQGAVPWWVLGIVLSMAAPATLGAQGVRGDSPGRQEAPSKVEYPSLADWARDYLRTLETSPGEEGWGSDLRLERIRAMYFLSVNEKDWVGRAADSIRVLLDVDAGAGETCAVLRAYQGALEVIRGKHARWPPNKLEHLERGSEVLDSLVSRHPGHLELRYLRYASYRSLPFFLARDEAVAEDRSSLAGGLPDDPTWFSSTLYRGVLRFVLDDESLTTDQRKSREAALERSAPQHHEARRWNRP